MRSLVVAAIVLFAWVGSLSAQVTVEVVSSRDQFLPDEELKIGVRISNFSGRTLHFGKDDKWIRIDIEGQGGPAFSNGTLPVEGEFEVESSYVATRWFDIAPHYELTAGRYVITASVNIREPGWEEGLISPGKVIFLFSGRTIWEQQVGLPVNEETASGPPEFRKYSLMQANFYNSTMKLYYRVADGSDTQVIKVAPLDIMAGFSKVDPQVDKFSNLHVLLQTPRGIAREYNYSVIMPDGRILLRKFYDGTDSQPRLTFTEDGLVRVVGGVYLGDDQDRERALADGGQTGEEAHRESLGVPKGAEGLGVPASSSTSKPEETEPPTKKRVRSKSGK